jgi:hypothetical protein
MKALKSGSQNHQKQDAIITGKAYSGKLTTKQSAQQAY